MILFYTCIFGYIGLFVVMIVMAAAHNWMAFVGFLIAFILATALAAFNTTNKFSV